MTDDEIFEEESKKTPPQETSGEQEEDIFSEDVEETETPEEPEQEPEEVIEDEPVSEPEQDEDLFADGDEQQEYEEEEDFEDSYVEESGDSDDSYVEESEESWFSRLGGAVKGVFIGGLIFLIGFPLLFWNEGRSVKRYRVLKEGAGSVVSVPADKVDPKFNNKLVHVTGLATTDEVLTDGEQDAMPPAVSIKPDKIDPKNNNKLVHVSGTVKPAAKIEEKDFGFAVTALKLKRVVKMYQWQEARGASQTDKKLGGKKVTKTSYTYKKTWSDKLISSDQFKQKSGHENPAKMLYSSRELTAPKVKLGAFDLPSQFLDEMSDYKALNFKKLPGNLPAELKGKISVVQGELFMGKDPKKPQIGDIRIAYMAVKPGDASIIAMQKDKSFVPYATDSGKKISQFVHGKRSLDEMMMPSGISVNAIKLKRSVQMYQWQEKKESKKVKKAGGGEKTVNTYSYDKTWSESVIDSDKFNKIKGHSNPKTIPYQSKTITAKKVNLGAFELSQAHISRISKFEPMTVNSLTSALPESLRSKAKIVADGYYIGKDSQSPQIGDIKVGYSIVKPTQVSLVAAQNGKTFGPYKINKDSIDEFVTGTQTSEQMLGAAQKRNTTMAWILRLAGFLAMFIGLTMVFKPLSVVLDVIPFLGNIAEKGTGLVAFLIAAGCSLVTIAIAWFFYRPLLSLLLIALAVGAVFGVKMLKERKGAKASMPKPPGAVPPPPPGN